MDYLSQLLESYDKLKKRKFKLVYIEEAAVQLDPEAQKKVDTYIATAQSKAEVPSPDNKTPVAEVPESNVWVAKEGKAANEVVFDGFPGPRKGKAFALTGSSNAKQNYNDFVKLLSGQQSDSQQQASAEDQTVATPIVPEVPQIDDISADTLQNCFNTLKNYCRDNNYNSPICKEKGFGKTSTSTGNIFTGKDLTSVYGRLAVGERIIYDPVQQGLVKQKLDDANIDIATEAYKKLVEASVKKENSCEDFTKSIGLIYGKDGKTLSKILLKTNSGDDSEGVLVKAGAYEMALLSMAHQNCTSAKRKQRKTLAIVQDGSKSQVKGSLSETTVDFHYLMLRYQSNISLKEKEDIKKFMAQYLQDKIFTIQKLAQDLNNIEEIATDAETTFINEILQEEALKSSNTLQLQKFLARELFYQRKIINDFFPNAVCAFNSAEAGPPKTGERPDRQFIYTSKQLAIQDFLQRNPTSTPEEVQLEEVTLRQLRQVIKARCGGDTDCKSQKDFDAMLRSGGLYEAGDSTKVFFISAGLKRYSELDHITLGTVASTNRMDDFFNPNYAGDHQLSEGFLDLVDQRLELDSTSNQSMLAYHEDLRKERKTIESTITSKYTVDSGKKPDLADPIQVIRRVSNIIGEKTLKTNEYASEILNLAEKATKLKKDSEGNIIDKTSIIPRLSHKIVKFKLINKLQNSLSSMNLKDKKACEDYLLRQLLITGSTKDSNMYQTIIPDNGKSSVIRHNEIFDTILTSRKKGKLKIEVTGSGARFIDTESNLFIDLNMNTSGKDGISFKAKLNKNTIEKLNKIQPTQVSEQEQLELFKEFFKIQEKILKSINQ